MNWEIIMVLALTFGLPTTAYAQNQTMDELVKEIVTESGKNTRQVEKMTDILDNCRDRVLELEASIIPPCLEIIKAYNQAMTNLFSQHRDTVETILYG